MHRRSAGHALTWNAISAHARTNIGPGHQCRGSQLKVCFVLHVLFLTSPGPLILPTLHLLFCVCAACGFLFCVFSSFPPLSTSHCPPHTNLQHVFLNVAQADSFSTFEAHMLRCLFHVFSEYVNPQQQTTYSTEFFNHQSWHKLASLFF